MAPAVNPEQEQPSALGGLILAGGMSRRMGCEKGLLEWQGQSFLARIAQALRGVCSPIVVVSRPDQTLAVPPGIASIADRQPGQGPLMGLATGLDYLADRGISWAFVTTCDAPLVQPEVARQLLRLAEGSDGAVPLIGERVCGLTAVYRTGLAPLLFDRLAQGERRVRDLPQWTSCRLVGWDSFLSIDPQQLSLRNVNTPEDYRELLGTRGGAESEGRAIDVATVDQALDHLRQTIQQFVAEREWQPFHSPKNLSMALAIEAAELMEHFQWLTTDESRQIDQRDAMRTGVEEEMADVFCYLLALANELEVPLAAALMAKMERNRQKYPVAMIRGRFGHHDPRPVKPEA